MNKSCNWVWILITAIFLFSCDNLLNRYDPVKESGFVFDLQEFVFYPWSLPNNSSFLTRESKGIIDRDKREVQFIFPPSLDLATTSLTADITVKNRGQSGDYYYWQQINRVWSSDPFVRLTKEFAGYTGYEETYYDLEYEIIQENVLTVDVNAVWADSHSERYPYNYLFTPNPVMQIVFNDDIQPTTLTAGDFSSNYPLAAPANITADYEFQIAPLNNLDEGIYSIMLRGGSCQASTPGFYNRESKNYTFAYDAAAPVVGNLSLDRTGSHFSPAADEETLLRLAFDRATDTLTPEDELEYKIGYSTAVINVTDIPTMYYAWDFIPVNGSEWFTYKSPLAFNYDTLPPYFRSLLTNGQHIYVNIIVRDNCRSENRSSLYQTEDFLYGGP